MPSKASNCASRGVYFIAATLALTGASFYQQASAYTVKREFPRLGGTKISSPQDYDDPDVQRQLARLDFVVVDFYLDWGGGRAAIRKAVQGIKAKNSNIVIVDYCILNQVHDTSDGQKPLRDKLEGRCCTNGRRGEFLPRATGGLEGGLRFGHAEPSHGIHGRHARIDLGHLTAETACLEPGTE